MQDLTDVGDKRIDGSPMAGHGMTSLHTLAWNSKGPKLALTAMRLLLHRWMLTSPAALDPGREAPTSRRSLRRDSRKMTLRAFTSDTRREVPRVLTF